MTNLLPLLALTAAFAPAPHAAQQTSPFAPPRASMHYAPDRTCDLLHIDVDLDVDYANRSVTGTAVNPLSPLRNGITEVMLMAGASLTISSIKLDGREAKYRREGR